jgi:hypothetical protein
VISKDAATKILIAVASAGAIALMWFLFDKVKLVWLVVDAAHPVSSLNESIKNIEQTTTKTAESVEGLAKNLKIAKDQLHKQHLELLQAPVRGEVGRMMGPSTTSSEKPPVFVNTNSDARRFKYGEEIEISFRGKTIRAEVQGTITNPNEGIVGQLSADAAEKLGLTKQKGVGQVTMRRIVAE